MLRQIRDDIFANNLLFYQVEMKYWTMLFNISFPVNLNW